MKVIFDNIIFTLQRSGGISMVWYELLKRAITDPSYLKQYINYTNTNIFHQQLILPDKDSIFLHQRPYVERYLSPRIQANEHSALFHSSYFRILPQKGIKNITTIHDFTYTHYRKGIPKYVHLWQERYAIAKSDGIICVSEYTKKDLLRFYPYIDEKKIVVIPNGVDERFYKLDRPDVTLPFNVGEYLLYVGNRQASYKNFNIAVEVAQKTKLPFVIVGTQLSQNEEQFLNASIGNQHYAIVADASVETLNLIYNGALCLLYPSLYEGFGIPIIEAQRAGCPVLCLNVASIPEVAGDGALIIDDMNKIPESLSEVVLDLKNGRIDKKRLQQRGITNSMKFCWDKTYQQTIAFYNKING